MGITKPIFQLTAVALSFYFLWCSFGNILEVMKSGALLGARPIRGVRFTVQGLRDNNLNIAAGNNFSFGFLRDGCPVGPSLNGSSAGPAIHRISEEVVANGYFILVREGQPAADPVRWTVEVSAEYEVALGNDATEETEKWFLAGASMWKDFGSLATFYPHIAYQLPQARSMRVDVDLTPHWTWIIINIVEYIVPAVGWFSGGACGALTTARHYSLTILSCTFILDGLLSMSVLIGYSIINDGKYALITVSYFLSDMILGIGMWYKESWFFTLVCTTAALKVVLKVNYFLDFF